MPRVAERATRTASTTCSSSVPPSRRSAGLRSRPTARSRGLPSTSLLRLYDEDGAVEQFAKLLDIVRGSARGYLVLLGILSAEDNERRGTRDGPARGRGCRPAGGAVRRGDVVAARGKRRQGARRDGTGARAATRLPAGRVRARAALTTVGRRDEALKLSAKLAATGDPFMQLSHAWQLLGEERREDAAVLFEELRRAGTPHRPTRPRRSPRSQSTRNASMTRSASSTTPRATPNRRPVRAGSARASRKSAATRWALRTSTRPSKPVRGTRRQLRAHALLREGGAPEMAELLIDDYLDAAPGDTIDVVSGVAAASSRKAAARGHRAR